jgi:hypothetical protein
VVVDYEFQQSSTAGIEYMDQRLVKNKKQNRLPADVSKLPARIDAFHLTALTTVCIFCEGLRVKKSYIHFIFYLNDEVLPSPDYFSHNWLRVAVRMQI